MGNKFIIQWIKCNTVMYISGGHHYIKHKIMSVTSCVCFISKTFFMFTLVKNSALRIGCAFTDDLCFCRWFIIMVIVKRLFPMFLAVSIYLFQ